MVTLDSKKILTLIYCFSKNENLNITLESSKVYLEEYAGAKNIELFIIE